MVSQQGGDASVVATDALRIIRAALSGDLVRHRQGRVKIDAMEIGLVACGLGAGRTIEDDVDFTAGVWLPKGGGCCVGGRCTLHVSPNR